MPKKILNIILLMGTVVSIAFGGLSQGRETAITRAIKKVGPSVASINVVQNQKMYYRDPFFSFFLPPSSINIPSQSSGSGVVISPDGYVLTNFHVIENAVEITVTLTGGYEYDAEIIGFDQTTDLALLKLDGRNFPFAEFGDSDDIIIGEWVIALGNPFNLFDISDQPTASAGIISASHMNFGRQESGKVFQNMIQTDAAINPGNSGGPLVNTLGEVIGINTFIFTGNNQYQGSIGIGFAIPINQARDIAEELKIEGRVNRSFTTGLRVQTLTRSISRYLELELNEGVIIVEVEPGSPADRSHLKPGDVIVKVGGQKVHHPSDIRDIITEKDKRSGDSLKLRIYRDGKHKTIKLKLGAID
ncbi:MAG: trypsin-like peptidase domain-containing protein [Candidatus Marinimicrobia bacterium]|nr:trypsin-like peptidase domain-containing protein [Candidatus Neomarinimicrobiota bacterium]